VSNTYSVLVLDTFHYHDPEYEVRIDGFPTPEAATEYARRRVRDSVEEFRTPECSASELRHMWFTFGEDVVVLGGGWKGLDELDYFVEHPATAAERDWQSLSPPQRERGTG
jgi:hypothetical protein